MLYNSLIDQNCTQPILGQGIQSWHVCHMTFINDFIFKFFREKTMKTFRWKRLHVDS